MITKPSTPQTDSERAVTLERVAVVPGGGIAPLALINGTSGDDIRIGTNDDDIINGFGGNDTLEGRGGIDSMFGGDGNDVIQYTAGFFEDAPAGEIIDGGAGFDAIRVVSGNVPSGASRTFTLRDATVVSIEEIEFFADGQVKIAEIGSHQLGGTGFATNLLIDSAATVTDTLRVFATQGVGTIDLSGWTFQDWSAGGVIDRVEVYASGVDASITGSSQSDTIFGGDGNDTLIGGGGRDSLNGGNGDDHITADGDGGLYLGEAGDDVMIGANGNNGTMDGGSGIDTLDLSATTVGRTVNLLSGGAPGAERLIGFEIVRLGSGNDNASGGSGNETFYGGGGNDTLEGRAGVDALYGGDGNDTIAYWAGFGEDAPAGEVIDGGAGFDKVVAAGFVSGSASANIFDWRLATVASIEEIEFAANDSSKAILIGSHQLGSGFATNLLIDGGNLGQTDRLDINVTQGVNRIDARGWTFQDWVGFDELRMIGDNAANTFLGSTQRDIIFGGLGADRVIAGLGDDVINGDDGNDFLRGDGGNDRIFAGNDDDRAFGGAGDDTIFGGNGDDVLNGAAGIDSLFGGTGNDTIQGGGGTDIIDGGSGNDILRGGAGADQLTDGSGADTMTGGTGADIFTLVIDGETDRITDFQDGIDLIRFVGQSFAALTITDISPGRVRIEVAGDVLIVRDGDAGTLTAADLTASDFLFS
jgi:Ca2+-binding RTX toxin-like protein